MTIRQKIQSLIDAANAVTGENDPTLTDAVRTLCGGYGQAGDPTAPLTPKDVNFIDCDGTVLHAYTAEEFGSLTAMPENPIRSGLTAQGWNRTLADAQDHVRKYGSLLIGQHYVTDDGKTRLYVRFEDGFRAPTVGFALNGAAEIDWGDGSEPDSLNGTGLSVSCFADHEYAADGDYVITIAVTDGEAGFLSVGTSTETAANLIKTGRETGKYDWIYRDAVRRIELGTGFGSAAQSGFRGLRRLESISVPRGLALGANYLFTNCESLKSIVIPPAVQSLGTGIFTGCRSLESVSLPAETESAGGGALSNAALLRHFTLPDSLAAVPLSLFSGCVSLMGITVPEAVETMGSRAFSGCSAMGWIRFLSDVPPAAAASNVFDGLPTDCVIYVPHGCREIYETETNYPDPELYTYEEDPA